MCLEFGAGHQQRRRLVNANTVKVGGRQGGHVE